MQVTVKLFAIARQLAGCDEVIVELLDAATVGDLRAALAEQHPAIAGLGQHVRFAVNNQYAADAEPIPPTAEVACIPPVSGG